MSTAQLALPRSFGALSPALAASLLVHATILVVLMSWVSLGERSANDDQTALAVRLVGEPQLAPPAPAAVSPPEQVAVAPADHGIATMPAPAPAPSRTTPPQPAASADPMPPSTSTAPARAVPLGSVDVRLQDQALMTGLPNVLAERTTSEFPVEVLRLVRMPSRPAVAYPPEALAAQRQGSVLAWITVEADGSVEEVIIVEGEPEFAAAVEAALVATRFAPAVDRSGPIRFYTLLRFDFAGGSPAAAAAAAAEADAAPRTAVLPARP